MRSDLPAAAQAAARRRERQIVLTQVHPVRTRRERDIEPIVHDHEHTRRARHLADLTAHLDERRRRCMFHPDLDHAGRRPQRAAARAPATRPPRRSLRSWLPYANLKPRDRMAKRERSNVKFKLRSDFTPTGDQPKAIAELVAGLKRGDKQQTLLGITGSGKTFTAANVIAQVNRPAQVIAPNKIPGGAALRRVQGSVPRERLSLLRLVLRLLPARGVRPDQRHVHRERHSMIATKRSTACVTRRPSRCSRGPT